MKSILISIKPKWCALMMNGIKKIEVRKGTALYKATQKLIDEYGYAEFYVYCTKEKVKGDFLTKSQKFGYILCPENALFNRDKTYDCNGKVLFKFRCYKVEKITPQIWSPIKEHEILKQSCLRESELFDYVCSHDGTEDKPFYTIHISDLEIFDKPKELSEFRYYAEKPNCQQCKLWQKYHEVDYCKIFPCNSVKLTKAPQNFCYVEELL